MSAINTVLVPYVG